MGRVGPDLSQLIQRRYSRRELLKLSAAGAMLAVVPASLRAASALAQDGNATPTHRVVEGYDAEILIRWGDPLSGGEDYAFNPAHLTAVAQQHQFGYNNDFIAYFPLPYGSQNPTHGLLCVNHETALPKLMHPEKRKDNDAVNLEAVGISVVEVERKNGKWRYITDSNYNRRITANTAIGISGPARGHKRMQTYYDPEGTQVFGTCNNCSGGMTPWGTMLSAEENFQEAFTGELTQAHPDYASFRYYGLGNGPRVRATTRFDITAAPYEANRFGWIVEVDPYQPELPAIKRTALGRFCHETATCAATEDGRLAVYSGDDAYHQFIYRFVSKDPINLTDRAANRNLLDEGTLYAAKLLEDGTLKWLPLVWGEKELSPENGFHSQADVLIETRRAAALLGATPMDRPEGIAIHATTGKVYVAMTGSPARAAPGPGNPSAPNPYGHIIALDTQAHAADTGKWEMVLTCQDPGQDSVVNPDNLTFGSDGRLWIATDRLDKNALNGIYAMELETRQATLFFTAPPGAEVCSPCFTPDGETLFVAVQHPAAAIGSNYHQPSTRWPDFQAHIPPRPSVVAISRQGGGKIG